MARALAVFVIPLIYFWLARWNGFQPRALLAYRDPSYCYLMNSFSIAMGEMAHFYDHPGSALQAAGGALIRLASGFSPLERSALFRDPARYLGLVAGACIFINAALLGLAGILALRRASLPIVLATQFLFFVVPAVIFTSGMFQPEAVLIAAGSSLWICFLARRRTRRWLWPLMAGTTAAVKLTFGGFAVIGVAWKSGHRRLEFLFFSALVFTAWCAAIWPERQDALLFITASALRAGDYNKGPPGLFAWKELGSRLARDFGGGDHSALFVIAALALGGLCLLRPLPRRNRRELAVAAGVMVASALIYIHKPTDFRYFLPVFAAFPSFFFLAATSLRRTRWRFAPLAIAAALLALNGHEVVQELRQMRRLNAEAVEASLAAEALIEAHPDCAVITYGPVPLAPSAFSFAASRANGGWRGALEEKYPHYFVVAPNLEFRGGKVAEIDRRFPCALVFSLPLIEGPLLDHLGWSRLIRSRARYGNLLESIWIEFHEGPAHASRRSAPQALAVFAPLR